MDDLKEEIPMDQEVLASRLERCANHGADDDVITSSATQQPREDQNEQQDEPEISDNSAEEGVSSTTNVTENA